MNRIMPAILAVLVLRLAAGEAAVENGLAIAPGLAFVEDVVPGKPIDLEALGLPLTITNRGNGVMRTELMLSDYMPYSLAAFECGFEYLPSQAWVSVTPRLLELASGEHRTGRLVLDIPDRPEHWNRHWVVCVETGMPSRMALGATLRMQARILVETAAREGDPQAGPQGELAIAPARVAMEEGADGRWTGRATVRSAAPVEAVYDVLDLRQVYPPATHADRHGRFFSATVTALTQAAWGAPAPASFTLKPGGEQRLDCIAHPSRALGPEERVQEVFFIARRAPVGAVAARCRLVEGRLYERMELIRLLYHRTRPRP